MAPIRNVFAAARGPAHRAGGSARSVRAADVGDDQAGSDLTGLIGGQPNVEPWLLVQGGRQNSGMVLGDNGAIVIDPGAEEADLDALDSLVREAGSEVVVVAV